MAELFQKKIKYIYERLGDDLSKEIFADRLMYSLTGNLEYILDIISKTEEGKEICSRLQSSNKRKVIFGAGIWGKNIVNTYRDIGFECFVDNKADGLEKEYQGLPVVSFSQFMKDYRNVDIVIASRLYHKEIYTQLLEAGIEKSAIVNAGMMIDQMSKRQYFDLPQLLERKPQEEVFVDGGSFDGKTAVEFVNWCGGNYKKIYAFEPDAENRIKCENTLSEVCGDRFEVISKGLWNEETTLRFSAIANGSSKVTGDGDMRIQVVCMDEVVHDKVTFIKLDVEGSEYQAILGAKKIIKTFRPRLAVSIYHKPEDIWKLPELIGSLNPKYQFYLRHYSTAASETVLYAI